ncbi:putative flagellar radial spoke component [Trypanosoma conorhini]|uniref:Putative flagellar radial spoke component n=1 Tax=Trypanosoma conorhini TaxID=83891 RepID=A0A422PRF4_9TRYP|nr:putative flagellar radial spoke component [Trypanosoma conorhini]RNF20335.1 putative flagellar radial spoke component [Trypanosoma conorhini]
MATQPLAKDVEEMFGRTKAYLMNVNKDGVSVYDQLTRLMEQLLDENPHGIAADPSSFNDVFTLLQQHSFVNGQSTPACNEPCPVPPSELARLAVNERLFERPPPEAVTTIEQPDPYTTVTTTRIKPHTAPPYDSVAQQNLYWAWAGCGVTEEEAFLLDRSITMLAMGKKLRDVRFFGKIFGTRANYYVVCSQRYVEEGEKVYKEVNTMPRPARRKLEVPVQPEPGFVGVNRLSFWVTSHPAAEWKLLPDVTPQQIVAGRRIKRLFTGDLTAAVIASPPFEWNEAVYLRVQLSRIASGTYISPLGALEEPEEDADEEEDADDDDGANAKKPKEAKYRPLTQAVKGFASEEDSDVTQWAKLDQWVHAEGYIYANGRQTKLPEKPEEEEEEEAEELQQQRQEEEEEEEEVVEEEEEDEKELFTPVNTDFLYAIINVPEAPKVDEEDEEEEEEEAADADEAAEAEKEEDDTPPKPVTDDAIPDDDPTKVKVAAWTLRVVNNNSKKHRVVLVRSLRWPGAVAFAADGGKRWGCVYFGNGLKKTDFSFTPTLAPPVLPECGDITEANDPTPATEKLVRRGEEPPEPDSEDEVEEEEAEGDM